LGLLFGQMKDGINKSELIVLITPQILDLETPTAAALERTKKMEEYLKKEPQPMPQRLLKD
jgi:type II secretory pathway component GspD/PulD (secretin)